MQVEYTSRTYDIGYRLAGSVRLPMHFVVRTISIDTADYPDKLQ